MAGYVQKYAIDIHLTGGGLDTDVNLIKFSKLFLIGIYLYWMEDFGRFFMWTAVAMCVLLGLLLIRFNNERKLQKYLLATLFFIMGWFAFIYIMITSKAMLQTPYLFRLGQPFYYLMPPLALVYVQLVIEGESPKNYGHLVWHMIPFVIGLADLGVYYYKHGHELDKIVRLVYQEPAALFFRGDGFIPAVFHYGFRPIQGCLYMGLTMALMVRAKKRKKWGQIKPKHREWLLVLVTFLTVFYLNNFYYTFLNPLVDFVVISKTLFTAAFLSVCFCLVIAKLFFAPAVIYPGMEETVLPKEGEVVRSPAAEAIALKEDETKTELLSAERVGLLAAEMEKAMKEQLLFKTITKLSDLAAYLDTSPRYVSYVLSNHYQARFNDFINTFRIQYIMEEIQAGKGKHFTLEAIASEAGFSSRSTFYTAFKKQTGLSPNQYVQEAS